MSLFVIACTASKNPGDTAAAFKYRGRQHNAMGAAFLAPDGLFAAGHDLAILSAEHGLLRCTDAVADYDRRMTAERSEALKTDRASFAQFVLMAEGHEEVVVYGPRAYRNVVGAWAELLGVDVVELTGADRGCGDHFSALQDHLAALDEDA